MCPHTHENNNIHELKFLLQFIFIRIMILKSSLNVSLMQKPQICPHIFHYISLFITIYHTMCYTSYAPPGHRHITHAILNVHKKQHWKLPKHNIWTTHLPIRKIKKYATTLHTMQLHCVFIRILYTTIQYELGSFDTPSKNFFACCSLTR